MSVEREREHYIRMREIGERFGHSGHSYKSPYAYSSPYREDHIKRSPFIFRDFRQELELGYEDVDEIIERYVRRLIQRGGISREEAKKRLERKAEQLRRRDMEGVMR